MKKILAILLILVLAFGCIGCGSSDENPSEGEGTGADQIVDGEGTGEGEAEGDGDADGEGGSEQGSTNTINPEDYYISDSYDEMEAAYDFDLEIASSFGLEDVVKKADYSDIGALAAEMEDRLNASAGKALNTSFSVFGDFEDDPENEIDKLSYAIGMENNDTEGIYLEGGVYHTQENKNYQYVVYISRNMYDTNPANTKEIIKEAEAAMGITFKEKELQKTIEQAFKKGQDTKDYFSLIDVETASGSGYDETITVSVDAFATEDNVIGYYVSCERERCYK